MVIVLLLKELLGNRYATIYSIALKKSEMWFNFVSELCDDEMLALHYSQPLLSKKKEKTNEKVQTNGR